MTKRKLNGYAFRQEVTRARNANRAARQALRRIIEETPSPSLLALLVAKISAALGDNLDAIQEIESIAQETKTE